MFEQDEAVGVVDLVGHAGHQDAQRGHLVGLDQLVLMAGAAPPAPGCARSPPGPAPRCAGPPASAGSATRSPCRPGASSGTSTMAPYFSHPLPGIAAARAPPAICRRSPRYCPVFLQDGEPFVEAGQKFLVPLFSPRSSISVPPRSCATGTRLARCSSRIRYMPGRHRHHRVVVLARGQQAAARRPACPWSRDRAEADAPAGSRA